MEHCVPTLLIPDVKPLNVSVLDHGHKTKLGKLGVTLRTCKHKFAIYHLIEKICLR